MLYSDSPQRAAAIDELSVLFAQKGFPKTSEKITSFVKILNGTEIPPDFLAQLDRLFDIFQEEFKDSLKEGKVYREKVFVEIKEIIVKALGRMHPDFSTAILEILEIVKNIKNARNLTGDIADELRTIADSNKKAALFLCCYAYVIMVEGIFDEIARALLFFTEVTKTNIPKASDLEKMSVWAIRRKFSPIPVFLENWEEKKWIRNAISHSTIYYDLNKNEVRFVDKEADYDKTHSFNDFMLIALQFDDVVAAFTYILLLLGILDLVAAKNLKFA